MHSASRDATGDNDNISYTDNTVAIPGRKINTLAVVVDVFFVFAFELDVLVLELELELELDVVDVVVDPIVAFVSSVDVSCVVSVVSVAVVDE